MANLPESATYDAGVYQLELTDPVQGGSTGVSNAPLKNLANRTAWLKSQIDGINNGTIGLALYARLASPTFTGSPAAPTAALGDNTTKLATTAFVQNTLGGVLSKSIAGGVNVTLTAVEAGNGILVFTGALTASISVIVPTAPTRPWVVFNNTTGAFTLTVKTASGTGVAVPRGKREIVYCDGTNVAPAFSDFVDVALEGVPTAPTPAQFDNNTSLATTAFVQRAIGNRQNNAELFSATALTAADAGKWINLSGSTTYTVTLPNISSVAAGAEFIFHSDGPVSYTVQQYGSDAIAIGGIQHPSVSIGPGEFLVVSSQGNVWRTAGSAVLKNERQFGASFLANGYQKLPSGLIIQWGLYTTAGTTNSAAISYPIAFPNNVLNVVATHESSTSGSVYAVATNTQTASSFKVIVSGGYGGAYVRWIAIGY